MPIPFNDSSFRDSMASNQKNVFLSPFPFRKLILQTAISAFLSFLTFAFGFLRVYYFSRKFSMEDFGVLSLLLTLSAFLIYIFTIGSFQFLFKSATEGPESNRSAFWPSLFLTIVISLFFTVVTFFWSAEISMLLNLSSFTKELELIILATASTSIMMVFLYHHYGLGRNNFQNFLQFLRGSLWVILSILFSLYFSLSLIQIFVIINLTMALILLLAFPWRELNILLPIKIKRDALSRLLRYCLPLLPYFAGAWGIPLIVRTQLNIYDGAREVAIFSVAYTLMEIIFMFVSTISATISPYFFAELKSRSMPGLFYNIMLKYSIVCILLILPFIFLVRYDVIRLIASEKYLISGDYIPILIFFPLLRVLIIVFEQFCLKTSQTVYLGTIYTAGIFFSVSLSAILIPRYSIFGAIYTSLASYLLIFICLYVKQRKIIDYGYINLPALAKFTLVLWATVGALYILDFDNIYKIILLCVTSVFGLILLPILNTQEKNKILELFKIKKK